MEPGRRARLVPAQLSPFQSLISAERPHMDFSPAKPGLYGPGVGTVFVALCGINTGVKNLISALDHELNRLGGGA